MTDQPPPALTFEDLTALDALLWGLFDGAADPDHRAEIIRLTSKLSEVLADLEPGAVLEPA